MMSARKQFEHLKIQLEAIRSATNNFAHDHLIGIGGYGKVYRGELILSKGHTTVAIKRLDRPFGEGDVEFWKEIKTLSLYSHENIVSLLGYCEDGGEKILVYEYSSKRSVESQLSSKNLSWTQRLKIAIGAARGLSYLHQGRILHRDIKSANILLDDSWTAKIKDLGLSKIGHDSKPHKLVLPHVIGSLGYIDPQYFETGILTKESDVYSFGVVLFEVLCGKLAIGKNYKHQPFPQWVGECYTKNNLDEIIYKDIKVEMNPRSLEEFTRIAYQCLRDFKQRPTMKEVLAKLESALDYQIIETTVGYQCLKRSREERPLMKEVVRILETALQFQVPPLPPPKHIPTSSPSSSKNGTNVSQLTDKRSLKTLHWEKTRATVGSIWDLPHKQGNLSRVPEIDKKKLESLFSEA
ncbi:unnamed protein product [Lactuca virosa]|uniref:Protein kinase domain-containing protein n=1 Tax=Lactuca virosa TaxID=75947 RepID=A0AAU9MPR3_9ASTR|nr:unnamed protein product [Lactuca virosa]